MVSHGGVINLMLRLDSRKVIPVPYHHPPLRKIYHMDSNNAMKIDDSFGSYFRVGILILQIEGILICEDATVLIDHLKVSFAVCDLDHLGWQQVEQVIAC